MAGWVKLRKDIEGSWIWKDAEKLKWYLWLLMKADCNDPDNLVNESLTSMAKAWGTSVPTASRFLDRLNDDGFVFCIGEDDIPKMELNFSCSDDTELEEEIQKTLRKTLQETLRKTLRKMKWVCIMNIKENLNEALRKTLRKPLQETLQQLKEESSKEENIFKDKEIVVSVVYNKLYTPSTTTKKDENLTDRYKNFLVWVSNNASWCSKNLKPIDEVTFYRLISDYSAKDLIDVILDIENYSKHNTYTSLARTCDKWLKKRAKDGTIQQRH